MIATPPIHGRSGRQFRSRVRHAYRAVGISIFLGFLVAAGVAVILFIVHFFIEFEAIWGLYVTLAASVVTLVLLLFFMTFSRKGWLFAARNKHLADEGAEIIVKTTVEVGARSVDGIGKAAEAVGDAAGDIDIPS